VLVLGIAVEVGLEVEGEVEVGTLLKVDAVTFGDAGNGGGEVSFSLRMLRLNQLEVIF